MSGFGYDGLQTDAADLIREAGTEMKFYRKTDGAYNVATGLSTVSESTIVAPVCLIGNVKQDRGRAIAGDKLLIIGVAGLANPPRIDDEVVIGGVRHKLVEVDPLSPDDATVVIIQAVAQRAS